MNVSEPMGPRSLNGLLGRLRVPDQTSALARIAHEVLPGQVRPTDRVIGLTWGTPNTALSREQVSAPFEGAERDRLLEAQTVVLRYGAIEVLVEQPELSGGLGAYVSRYGEGLAALYLERPGYMPPVDARGRLTRPMRTPLRRRGWLLPHEWPWGPFGIVLEER